ncbi:hypothetical protein ABZ412_17030 [Nocardia sp. NPDC005746]|uniref:hypothetical protein n=1 Tax=Nocardia sp. NPDC005746 TaxID=3157062 RepID=UPI0033C516A4
MDADFTTGPGDSRSARQPGYRLTHPDAPGTSPNPVLTGIDTGGHAGFSHNGHDGLSRNGHDSLSRNGHDGLSRNGHDQQVQWSSAPVTLRGTPESEALSRRIAPDLPQRSADQPQRNFDLTQRAPELPQRAPELPQRTPELPQRTSDPEAVAARLAADEPFSARITTDSEPFAVPVNGEPFGTRPATNGSPFARSIDDSGPLTRPADSGQFTRSAPESEPFAAPSAMDSDTLGLRPAPEVQSFALPAEPRDSAFGASPAVEFEAPVSRRYAPDPEPVRYEIPERLETPERLEIPERLEAPARLESLEAPAGLASMEAVAASLRESVHEAPRESTRPAGAPSRRRAAPEPVVEHQVSSVPEPIAALSEPVAALSEPVAALPEPVAALPEPMHALAEPTPIATESTVIATESTVIAPVSAAATPESKAAAEFRTSDAAIDLHHIMRLLVASHDLDVAATAVESGEADIAQLADAAHRTRSAAVELVAAWYGGADHMRNFGEVLLRAAAETR